MPLPPSGPAECVISLAMRYHESRREVLHSGRVPPPVGVEILTTPELLSFAGITPVAVPVIPLVFQVAEKLHAYTRVYEGERVSNRIKDLVDLAPHRTTVHRRRRRTQRTIEAIFVSRATHEPPRTVPRPPRQWQMPFRQLAHAVGLDDDLNASHTIVAAMLDPILDHHIQSGTWEPEAQRWVGATADT